MTFYTNPTHEEIRDAIAEFTNWPDGHFYDLENAEGCASELARRFKAPFMVERIIRHSGSIYVVRPLTNEGARTYSENKPLCSVMKVFLSGGERLPAGTLTLIGEGN